MRAWSLSAESPRWNAATRSGRGSGFDVYSGSARRGMGGVLFGISVECQRALIEFAPPPAGYLCHLGDGVLQREPFKRIAQQPFTFGCTDLHRRLRRCNHNDDLAAELIARARLRKPRQFTALDLLMQLGEFAA